jgi:hypothetical protein
MKLLCKTIILFFIILAVNSCTTTKYIEKPIEIEKIKTEYITKYITDSIAIKDSIDRYRLNDTVYIYKERIRTQYINRVDTIHSTDSIPYEIKTTITKTEKVNVLKWYQKIFIFIGSVFCLYLLYKLIVYIKRKYDSYTKN